MGTIEHDWGTVRRRDDRTLVGAVGAVVAAAVIAVTAEPLGILVGIALIGAWVVLSVPYVFALGHLGLAALLPDSLALPALAVLEAGFVLVLVGPFVERAADPRIPVTALAVAVALLGTVGAGLRWSDSIPATALVLAVTASVAAYGLHRYELVRLGLVEP